MECEWGAGIGLWKKADNESFMGDQESTRVASRFSAPFQRVKNTNGIHSLSDQSTILAPTLCFRNNNVPGSGSPRRRPL